MNCAEVLRCLGVADEAVKRKAEELLELCHIRNPYGFRDVCALPPPPALSSPVCFACLFPEG